MINMENTIRTPIAFIIFNRPDTTVKVFERIRQSRTPKLFVIADGPRADKMDEAELCKATRSIIESVDWPCEVLTNYSDVNLGCKRRVSSGLDWVFDTVEEAIILEDDCVPEPSFFRFCEDLLSKYRDDERIMLISGDNFQFGRNRTKYSYYFSRYAYMWGWASWRRSWSKYDVNMRLWPEIRDGKWLQDIFFDRNFISYWKNIFEKTYNDQIDTWDYQWIFACMIHSGLVIIPSANLISNIGFGEAATHTNFQSIFGDMKTEPLRFPLSHPPYVLNDSQTDLSTGREFFVVSYFMKAKHKLELFRRKYLG